MGHGKLAKELRDIIDSAKARSNLVQTWSAGANGGEFSCVLRSSYPKARLGDLILSDLLVQKVWRVIREHRQASRILEHGLSLRRKLLFIGPQGTGKKFTASVLAGELGLPLLQVHFDGLFARFKGETPTKLREVFDAVTRTRGVYFFGQVDVLGSRQAPANEVVERDRVLDGFFAMIEQDDSRSIVVASVCRPKAFDMGLFACFEDVWEYEFPNESQIAKLLEMRLRTVAVAGIDWAKLADLAVGLSYSEVSRSANDVLKIALISEMREVRESDINFVLTERKAIADRISTYAI